MEDTMKSIFSAAIFAGFTFAFATVPAIAQTAQSAPRSAEERDREMAVKPELSPELAARWKAAPRQRALMVACTTQKVAFHASGNWYGSAGADAPMVYPNIVTNVGTYYTNLFGLIGVFTAPCDGQYFFTVTFVKDSYYSCGGAVGTTDDVSIYLTKGNANTPIDSGHSAWSGEDSGRRSAGVYSVVLSLLGGDQIATWVHSDGGRHRCLASYQFTGFRVTP
jgi:hypothetical protein